MDILFHDYWQADRTYLCPSVDHRDWIDVTKTMRRDDEAVTNLLVPYMNPNRTNWKDPIMLYIREDAVYDELYLFLNADDGSKFFFDYPLAGRDRASPDYDHSDMLISYEPADSPGLVHGYVRRRRGEGLSSYCSPEHPFPIRSGKITRSSYNVSRPKYLM